MSIKGSVVSLGLLIALTCGALAATPGSAEVAGPNLVAGTNVNIVPGQDPSWIFGPAALFSVS